MVLVLLTAHSFNPPQDTTPSATYSLPASHPGYQATVTGSYKDTELRVTRIGGKQVDLKLPAGWCPMNPNDASWPGPTVRWVPRQAKPTLLVRAFCESGVYGYTGIFFFQEANANWRLVPQAKPFEFSDRGGYELKGARLLTWDMNYKPDQECHSCAHQYRLQEYILKNSAPHWRRTRFTKAKYTVNPDSPPTSSKADPLHEFGLHWPATSQTRDRDN